MQAVIAAVGQCQSGAAWSAHIGRLGHLLGHADNLVVSLGSAAELPLGNISKTDLNASRPFEKMA